MLSVIGFQYWLHALSGKCLLLQVQVILWVIVTTQNFKKGHFVFLLLTCKASLCKQRKYQTVCAIWLKLWANINILKPVSRLLPLLPYKGLRRRDIGRVSICYNLFQLTRVHEYGVLGKVWNCVIILAMHHWLCTAFWNYTVKSILHEFTQFLFALLGMCR